MNEIKITAELSAEDRKRLDDIAQAMGYLAGQISLLLKGPAYEVKQPDPVAGLPEEVKEAEKPAEVKPEEHPVENPFPEAPAEPEEDEPKQEEPKAPEHTKDEVRKLVVTLSANGKKAEARDIVLAHGTSITDLPEESIDAVYNALKEILEG